MEIEMRLTAAKGIPPTEDEILAMWEIEHQQPPADQEEVPRA
jgi:hypothetical protein